MSFGHGHYRHVFIVSNVCKIYDYECMPMYGCMTKKNFILYISNLSNNKGEMIVWNIIESNNIRGKIVVNEMDPFF